MPQMSTGPIISFYCSKARRAGMLNLTCSSSIGCTHPPEMHLYYKGTSPNVPFLFQNVHALMIRQCFWMFSLFPRCFFRWIMHSLKYLAISLFRVLTQRLSLSIALKQEFFLYFLKSCCLYHQVWSNIITCPETSGEKSPCFSLPLGCCMVFEELSFPEWAVLIVA